MAQRIKNLREHLGLSQHGLAAQLGVSQNAISKIERGESEPGYGILESLVKTTGVSAKWLLTGDEPMFPSDTPEVLSTNRTALVPVFAQRAAAGALMGTTQQAEVEDWVALPSDLKVQDFDRLAGIRVTGDSMAPTILAGDLLLCTKLHELNEIRDNRIYVVVTADGVAVKRVVNRERSEAQLILKSDNRAYGQLAIPVEAVDQVWRVDRRVTADLSGPDTVYDRLNDLEQLVLDMQARLKKHKLN